MANYQFGAGKLIVRPYTGAGVVGAPIELATLQEADIDFKINTKKLYGPYRFPVAVADGEGEIPLTAKAALFYGNAFNLFLGSTSSAGGQTIALDELGTIATAAYSVVNQTAFVPNTSVVWLTPAGGGVARQLSPVAATPVAGVSYVESGGNLTFAAADNGATVRVTYAYTLTSGGQKLVINNALQNTSLGAQVTLYNQSLNRANNKPSTFILNLNQVILPGLKMSFKIGDFTIPDYTMDCFSDQNNVIGTAYLYNYDAN